MPEKMSSEAMSTAVLLPVDGEPKEVPFDITPMSNHQGEILGGAVSIVGPLDECSAIVLRRRDPPADSKTNPNRLPAPMHRARIPGPVLVVKTDDEGKLIGFTLEEYKKHLRENPPVAGEGHDEDLEEEEPNSNLADLMALMAEGGEDMLEALAANMGGDADDDEDDEDDDDDDEDADEDFVDEDGDDDDDEDEEDLSEGEEDLDDETAKEMINQVLIKKLGMSRDQLQEKVKNGYIAQHKKDPSEEELETMLNQVIMGIIAKANDDEEGEEDDEDEGGDPDAASSSAPPAKRRKAE